MGSLEENQLLKISIHKIYEALDNFIECCLDPADGKPKTPDYKSIMRARSVLPVGYKNTLTKKI